MAAVVLILGLVAAGVYTSSWGFYVAAVIGGGIYALILLSITLVAASAKTEINKLTNRNFPLRKDNPHD